MFIVPGAILGAQDASNARRSDKGIEARQVRPPGATTPVQGEDDGDIISMILSGIFGGIGGDQETTTSTRSTRTTSTRASTTSSTTSTSTTTSTRSTPTVVTPTPPPPVSSTTSSSTTRPTTVLTQTVDGSANNTANTPSKPNSGLPSVVIGVIVAAAVIFGLIFIALIARKVFQARRRRRRTTWTENGGISPFQDPLVREKALPPPPPPETQEYASYPAYPPPAVTFANQPAPYSPAAASSAGFPAPYPFGGTGNNVQPNATTTTAAIFQAKAYTPADLAGPVVIQQTPPTPIAGSTMPAAIAQLSVVKRTFIPSLPDELSIATGEQVRVLSLYDDGWALCEKMTGEKGVVPQECLESAQPTTSNTPAQQLAGSEESARLNRNSSLRRGQDQTY